MRSKSRTAVAVGAALAITLPAAAQTPPAPDNSGVIDLDVTAKRLDAARTTIQPSLGATKYEFSPRTVDNLPQGDQAPLNEVLLRRPAWRRTVSARSMCAAITPTCSTGSTACSCPKTLSLFSQSLATQFAHNLSLMTGALPAQYGLSPGRRRRHHAKSGTTDPGAEVSVTAARATITQTALSYGGRSGSVDYFVTGQFLHIGVGIENPTASFDRRSTIDTDQWHGACARSPPSSTRTRASASSPAAPTARFQIPNNPDQTPRLHGRPASSISTAARSNQRQWENTYFGIVSLQKHYGTVDFQLSGFTRYSTASPTSPIRSAT